MKNIFRMFKYIPGEKLRITGLILFSIAGGLINAGIPILFRNLVNSVTAALSTNNFEQIYLLVGTIIAILFVDQIISFFKEKVADVFRMHIMTKLRMAIYPKILSLDIGYIEKHQPGAVMQKTGQGVGNFTQIIFSFSDWAGTVITSTVFILLILWFQNIWLGLLFTITFVLMLLISLKKTKVQKPYMKASNKLMEEFYARLNQTVSHLETIKTMSAEKGISKKFAKTNLSLQSARLKQFAIQRKYNFIRDFVGAIAIGGGLLITIYLITKRQFSAGDIFLIALYSRTLTNSIQPLGRLLQETSEVDYTSKRLIDFLETKPEFVDPPEASELRQFDSVEFRKVTYDYKDGKKGAVKNMNFTIDTGKTIALVGPSGVGKSTLTKLLLRFYEPTSGKILINGKDVSHFTQDSIRQHIGMVMQDVALFNATILENLQIANSSATESQIITAAKQAHADEFIRQLPKGYNTLVGERGVKLSGGQKQRIAIARAILKNPQLIVLDEATSALDSQSERLVQDGLEKLMSGRSALIIAHRLSTVMHADEILVLQKGTIVERGTHAQLIKYNGLYKKLFEMQSASGKVRL